MWVEVNFCPCKHGAAERKGNYARRNEVCSCGRVAAFPNKFYYPSLLLLNLLCFSMHLSLLTSNVYLPCSASQSVSWSRCTSSTSSTTVATITVTPPRPPLHAPYSDIRHSSSVADKAQCLHSTNNHTITSQQKYTALRGEGWKHTTCILSIYWETDLPF